MINFLDFFLVTLYMVVTFHMVALKYRRATVFHDLHRSYRTLLVTGHFLIVITNILLFFWLILKDHYVSPAGIRVAGLFFFVVGSFFIFWTIYMLGNAIFIPVNKLKITGPFAYVRHPMYLGGCMGAFGLSLFCGSLSGVMYSIVLTLVLYRVSCFEEEELEARFGRDYIDYKNKINRFIPLLF